MKKRLHLTPLQWVCEAISVALLVLPFVYLLLVWKQLPTLIPTHYDAAGVVNAWGNKNSIWFLPCVGVGLYALITILSCFPKMWNVPVEITEENREDVYRAMRWFIIFLKLCMQIIFLYLTLSTTQVNLGAWFLPVTLVAMFGGIAVCIAYIMKKYGKQSND